MPKDEESWPVTIARRHQPGGWIPQPGQGVRYGDRTYRVISIHLADEEDHVLKVDHDAGDMVMYVQLGPYESTARQEATASP